MFKVITESLYHKTVNGTPLAAKRDEMGLTQTEFAEKAGWSQPFQSQIEAPGPHEVPISIADKIEEIIA